MISLPRERGDLARPKRIDKTSILTAAEELITETGGMHFSMDMVAAKAGISKGGLIYTYPTKDALIEDMLRRELTRFVAQRETLENGKRPLERLEAHIKASAERRASAGIPRPPSIERLVDAGHLSRSCGSPLARVPVPE